MNRDRYLVVESHDNATVDFISESVSVEISIKDGKLEVKAKMSHGENASTWAEREVSWDIPEKE